MLDKALETVRAAEATQSHLKQMKNLHEVNAVGKKTDSPPKKNFEYKKPVSGSMQHAD